MMRTNARHRLRLVHAVWLLSLAVLLAACQPDAPSVLNPRGEGAQHIANLWWVMFAIAAVVYGAVVVMLVLALVRPRRSSDDLSPDLTPNPPGSRAFIVANGIVIPVIILAVVFGLNLYTLAALSPADATAPLTIEVIGQRWWWEVRYPQHGIISANEIHIPVGTRVELRLSSLDVIHSMWIPELNGKTDMIPGQSNRMFLYTDEPGQYRGQCAEFCGLQHAKMALYVVAEEQDDFEAWIAQQQQPAPEPQTDLALRGQQIFLGSSCVYCHRIRGTNASGVIGPDLTHFASRLTIGAGAVENTRGNLAGWIIDPQSIKPGNRMPPMYLEADELQAILAYMETLQ
jgi:cytochrome c oxidase subunit 2